MDSQALFARYRELQQYVGWSDEDVRRIQAAQEFMRPLLPSLIDDFYREIDRHAEARKVITGGDEQVERLKGTLLTWLDELLSGCYDQAYVLRRWKVGWRHVEIGLSQVFTNVALSRLRDGLFAGLYNGWKGESDELYRTVRSLSKLLDLDLAIIEDAYQTEYLKRQQQNERLAAIGQMSGGVAHELRNPLNVIKTSVYYLLNARNPTEEKKVEHLQRIQRQVDVADAVTTALSDFAKASLPHLQAFDLEPCLRESLEINTLPPQIKVSVDCPGDLPPIWGDRRQLAIVFGNLIRNARDAMSDAGQLQIKAELRGDQVEISFADNGEGIPEENLEQMFEPLFSTKARGIGLGLAMSRAILEKHDAKLEVVSQPGTGSTFTISIASAKPEIAV